MAYVVNKQLEEDENQPGTGTPSSGTIGAGGATPGGGAQPAFIEQGGSQFPDVSQYLSANANQGKRMAAKVGQGIVQEGADVGAAMRGVQNQFGSQVAANRIDANQGLLNKAKKDPTQFFGYEKAPPKQQPMDFEGGWTPWNRDEKGRGRKPWEKQAAPDWANYLSQTPGPYQKQKGQRGIPKYTPSYKPPEQAFAPGKGAAMNPGEIGEIQKMLNANYQGPTDISKDAGFENVMNELAQAQLASQQAGTMQGREDLLQKTYGLDSQRGGVSMLDQMLLNSGGGQDILTKAAQGNATSADIVSQAQQDAAADVASAQAATQGSADAAQAALTGEGGALQNLFNQYNQNVQAVEDFQNQRGNRWKRDQQGYSATTEEQMQLDALNQLLGQNYNFEGGL